LKNLRKKLKKGKTIIITVVLLFCGYNVVHNQLTSYKRKITMHQAIFRSVN